MVFQEKVVLIKLLAIDPMRRVRIKQSILGIESVDDLFKGAVIYKCFPSA
jgi:hypothetical protein